MNVWIIQIPELIKISESRLFQSYINIKTRVSFYKIIFFCFAPHFDKSEMDEKILIIHSLTSLFYDLIYSFRYLIDTIHTMNG